MADNGYSVNSSTGVFVGLGTFILACCFARCACGVTKFCYESTNVPAAAQIAEQDYKTVQQSYRGCVSVQP